jgi:hypothetical protein
MFRTFHSGRTNDSTRLASKLVLALALTTGTAVGVAGFAQPAYAQKKKEAKAENSKGFIEAYQPVDKAFKAVAEGGDYSAVKAQVPAMVAAVENADDRLVAGQMVLVVGNKAKDPALQRQGLELMLASGKVAPEQVGQFQYFVGSLAYQANDYAAARTALEAAVAAGYSDEQLPALMAESYFGSNAQKEGLAYLTKAAQARQAAGQAVPESWLLRGLQVSYETKDAAASNDLAALLVASSPTPKNWQAALQVVREVNTGWSTEEILDLSRLMLVSGGMKIENDLIEYIEAADPRKLSNEVLAALDAGTKAGLITAGEPRFAEVRAIAQERSAADKADAAKAKGSAPATGTAALGNADLLLSVGDYAGAEAMYQVAIDKGGIDTNRALTRKGIVQARQGKKAEAEATFAQVQGARAPLAKLWAIYAEKGTAASTTAAAAASAPAS